MATQLGLRIKVTTKAKALGALRASVDAFEQKYKVSSERCLKSVRSGKTHETPEIGRWLSDYRVLKRLEGQYGHTTGSQRIMTRKGGGPLAVARRNCGH